MCLSSRTKLADTLQILYDLTYIPRLVCNRFEPFKGDISHNMFCALSSTGSTTVGGVFTIRFRHPVIGLFTGDSGGPVLIPHRFNDIGDGKPSLDRLVGITSFGAEEANSSYPGMPRFVCPFAKSGFC